MLDSRVCQVHLDRWVILALTDPAVRKEAQGTQVLKVQRVRGEERAFQGHEEKLECPVLEPKETKDRLVTRDALVLLVLLALLDRRDRQESRGYREVQVFLARKVSRAKQDHRDPKVTGEPQGCRGSKETWVRGVHEDHQGNRDKLEHLVSLDLKDLRDLLVNPDRWVFLV